MALLDTSNNLQPSSSSLRRQGPSDFKFVKSKGAGLTSFAVEERFLPSQE